MVERLNFESFRTLLTERNGQSDAEAHGKIDKNSPISSFNYFSACLQRYIYLSVLRKISTATIVFSFVIIYYGQ